MLRLRPAQRTSGRKIRASHHSAVRGASRRRRPACSPSMGRLPGRHPYEVPCWPRASGRAHIRSCGHVSAWTPTAPSRAHPGPVLRCARSPAVYLRWRRPCVPWHLIRPRCDGGELDGTEREQKQCCRYQGREQARGPVCRAYQDAPVSNARISTVRKMGRVAHVSAACSPLMTRLRYGLRPSDGGSLRARWHASVRPPSVVRAAVAGLNSHVSAAFYVQRSLKRRRNNCRRSRSSRCRGRRRPIRPRLIPIPASAPPHADELARSDPPKAAAPAMTGVWVGWQALSSGGDPSADPEHQEQSGRDQD